ncbi:hypothetical protein [Umezawaea sp. Da 62-37]|uniref:hypothetical protein n=1 Tax=Umezawaea sp. Da 62-37 TaxID=3075927 RepID=UPI0028F7134E|nr:hypothetical protein [Umezawaea sp. Da 62-37]WNV87996.1 hypothetical protein RM788_06830 [Umezawaea sp. Da 62-37]
MATPLEPPVADPVRSLVDTALVEGGPIATDRPGGSRELDGSAQARRSEPEESMGHPFGYRWDDVMGALNGKSDAMGLPA